MKDKKVSVRFTDVEYTKIDEEAQSKNISISALLRKNVLYESRKEVSSIDISKIKKQLLIIQQNMDEICRTYNKLNKEIFDNPMEEIWNELL